MKTHIKFILFAFLCLLNGFGFSQIKSIGLPFIVNHPRTAYNASTQNWSVTQNSRGFMYFGNNDGVLEYDGSGWNVYPVPNASVVRSVMASGDTIYAGAFEQIGFLAPDKSGRLQWNSLNYLIPPEYKHFDEVWNIFRYQQKIIFQSFSYIFVIENGKANVILPEGDFGFMHKADNNLFVVDSERGLMHYADGSLTLLSDHPVFFRNEITSILTFEKGQLLVGTSGEGFFILDRNSVRPWQNPLNARLQHDNPYSGIRLRDGNYAFGTISNGIYIADKNGRILQHMNRVRGLQNNTILALFQDRRGNLWLGLDNGIDYVEISSPLSLINHNFNIESVYATIIHNGVIYVGTNQGLYAAKYQDVQNTSDNNFEFELIAGTKGQVWSLSIINNTLLCGHNYGCFQVEGYQARQISDIRGFWSFIKPPEADDLIIAGTYTGLVTLEKQNGNWFIRDEIDDFRESSRDMYFDSRNNLWISHGYRGLYKLNLNQDYSRVEKSRLFYNKNGLAAELPYNIQNLKGQMLVTTRQGILKYDYDRDLFVPDQAINSLFRNKGFIDKIHHDNYGNLWYFTHNSLGLLRLLEDGTFRDITSPFSRINDFLLPAFENIYTTNTDNVFIGSQTGLIHYNSSIINDYTFTEQVYQKQISFYGKQSTKSFFTHSDEVTEISKAPTQLPYSLNSVSFQFTTPVFENPAAVRFSYRLTGFDSEWSEWEALNFKEYTNLREGKYVFEVKAMNAFGMESRVSSFHFYITPPFLRSKTALFIYSFLLILIISSNIYIFRKRVVKVRQREKIKHEKRLAHREKIFQEKTTSSENEIMNLRNERLKIQMQHKNKELANATMHLIQKNKTLTYLRNDISSLLKNIPGDHPEKHNVSNLLKKVNKDLRNEKNWEVFNNYFDEVHQDFLNRLKEQYTDLTPKELRLCAYLRMNLSTKEIAPLINISIRGVEISRYRLRKKLKLDNNTNLTDFLLNI